MTQIKNILLIGKTKNGKSTLANVLSESDDFKEGNESGSTTKKAQSKEFEVEVGKDRKIKFQVVDTIGLNDTSLSQREVLLEIANSCHAIKDGLYQIFFVTKGAFTEEEVKDFNLISELFFDQQILNYVTIVRTDFVEFTDETKCEGDKQNLINSSPQLDQAIKSCQGIIHINNPPLVDSWPEMTEISKKVRKKSREKLLKYLLESCGNHHPIGLEKLEARIGEYMTEKERLEKALEEVKNLAEEEKQQLNEKLTELETKIEVKTKEVLS